MKSNDRWIAVGLCIACLPLAACAKPPVEEEVESRAVKVEQIEGSDLSRVTLTAEAAKRLDIQTAPLRTVRFTGRSARSFPMRRSCTTRKAIPGRTSTRRTAHVRRHPSRSTTSTARRRVCRPARRPARWSSRPARPSCTAPRPSSRKNDPTGRCPAMIRWIVGTSLKFRFIVLAIAAAMMVLWHRPAPQHAGGRLSRVRAAPGGDPDAIVSGCRPRKWNPWSPCRWSRRSTGSTGLDIMRSKSIPDLSSIELLFKPGTDVLARTAAGPGAPGHRAAHAADLGGPAGDDAARVDDRPGHEDRAVLEERVADGHVDDRLLDDPGAPAAVPGVANVAIWGERIKMPQVQVDPAAHAGPRVSRSTR